VSKCKFLPAKNISGCSVLRHIPAFPRPVDLRGSDHPPNPSHRILYYSKLSQQEDRRYRRARCSGFSIGPRDRAQARRGLCASAQTGKTAWGVRMRYIREGVRHGTGVFTFLLLRCGKRQAIDLRCGPGDRTSLKCRRTRSRLDRRSWSSTTS
jgi:hypothetical protein